MAERGARWLLPWLLLPALAQAGLFDSDAVLELSLEGPVDTLIAQKKYPAERTFQLRVDGQQHQVGVRTRGKSRLELCEFPPLSLNFGEQGGPPGSLFEGIKTLKLVTHCLEFDTGEVYALGEYAVYRILSLLTDYGYRVRLLRVTYLDVQGDRAGRSRIRHAFAIEPQNALAQRVGGERVRTEAVSLARLDAQQQALVYVFQYLVGNTDWSLVTADGDDRCCHNGDLVERDGRWFYVPFDFDQAGLVDARYARPHPSLRIRSVSQRVYRGFCTDPAELSGALQRVMSLEPDILAVIDALPMLYAKARAERREYLEEFFERGRKPERLLNEFEEDCLR